MAMSDRDRARHRAPRGRAGRVHRRARGHHHPHAGHGRGAGRQLRPSRHADGDGAGRLHAVAAASCASIRRTRSGPAAIASCSRSGTPRRCSTRCCTWPASRPSTRPTSGSASWRSRSRTSSASARSTRAARATRSTAGRRASRPRPARSARAWRPRVGMAIAGHWLAAHFNRPGYELFDYDVYALCGDGDMMEGITSRGRLAGRSPRAREPLLDLRQQPHHDRGQHEPRVLRRRRHALHRLRLERHARRRRQRPRDARPRVRDVQERDRAADADHRRQPHRLRRAAQAGHQRRPTASRSASRRSGSPRSAYGWPEDAQFLVPDGVREHFAANLGERGRTLREAWMEHFERYQEEHPDLADQLAAHAAARAARGLGLRDPRVPARREGPGQRASPRARCSNAIAKHHPWLLGGAADLAPSTKTQPDVRRRRLVRAATTATAATSTSACASTRWARPSTASRCRSCAPYGSGFLIFSDYGRAPIRLGALMEIPTIHIFTHDSIGVGEDGPTHQPIEHLASLRAMPALITIRPGDANEVAEAWRLIMELKHDPVVLGAVAAGDADARPRRCTRRPSGVRAGRLRARRPGGRRPRGDHHGHRHRGAAGGRRVRAARPRRASGRAWSACRRGTCSSARTRTTATSVLPPGDHRPGRRRAGVRLRLGSLRRPDRHDDRDAVVRHVGAAEGPPAALRVHARGGGGCRACAAERRVSLGDDPSPRYQAQRRQHDPAARLRGLPDRSVRDCLRRSNALWRSAIATSTPPRATRTRPASARGSARRVCRATRCSSPRKLDNSKHEPDDARARVRRDAVSARPRPRRPVPHPLAAADSVRRRLRLDVEGDGGVQGRRPRALDRRVELPGRPPEEARR